MTDKETVGSVTLDLTYYSGEDFYTDGAIEDELLKIVQKNPLSAFPKIIAEKKSWPVFYHLSPFRTNIIDWLPIKKTDKVLEIGSGCGAITGALAKRAGSVTCIDLSKKRSLVNAYRNKACDNITIKVGNFKDIEPHLEDDFDYVMLIGVFEYGHAYIGGNTPYEDFMRICSRHRKADGRLIIAIENKFGLKYWAGCREDHLGTYFSGLEGYREGGLARTFTRNGLEQILARVGIGEYSFYYPYPDYKFMTTIYSDQYLPRKGELSNNLRNFDRERALLFDEKQVFDEIIAEKEFPLFSNSYLLVVGQAPDTLYAKFSNDRDPKWAIQTKIVKNAAGQMQVEKLPDTEAAQEHLKNTQKAYELLTKRYEGTKIEMNKCSPKNGRVQDGLVFEYCNGVTLESLLDECRSRNDRNGFAALIKEYMEWLSYGEDAAVSNIDFIFPNILIDGEQWHVIDYEWTVAEKIPSKEIAFRAFYHYILGGQARKECEPFLLKETLGLSDEEIDAAVRREQAFQHHINGDKVSVSEMRERIGNRAYEFEGMLGYCRYVDSKFAAKLYFDYGEGFCEEHSVEQKGCYVGLQNLHIDYAVAPEVVRVRIDPCSFRCVVGIRSVMLDDRLYVGKDMETNGCWHPCGSLIFDSDDPNITIDVNGGGNLHVDMEVMELPEVLAANLVQEASKQDIITKTKQFMKQKIKKGDSPAND